MPFLTVPTVIVIALFVAILIYQLPVGQGFFRGTVYFPLIMPVVIAANIWAYIVNRDFGPVNAAPELVWRYPDRLVGRPILGHPCHCEHGDLAWLWLLCDHPFAALQSIPKDMYEAARIDGAQGLAHYLEHHHSAAPSGARLLFYHGDHLQLPAFRCRLCLDQRRPRLVNGDGQLVCLSDKPFSRTMSALPRTMGVVLLFMILSLSLIQLKFFRMILNIRRLSIE